MKKRYQMESQRAVQNLRRVAKEENPTLNMMLPMSEVVGMLQQGVGELLRQAGLELMNLVMEEEVRSLVGKRSEPNAGRSSYRWGSEDGFCVIDGQKVPLKRIRVRDKQNRERRLGSYELFQRDSPRVWDSVTRGLSTRNYGPLVKDFAEAYGVEKSTVSERFVEASREKLKGLMERPLGDLRLCALLIDATPFKGHHMIVALGIGCDGRKMVLGLRQGATENAAVVGELLSDLLTRGLDFTQPRLYVLDGSKALHSAVRKHAGDAALVQRCQVHKRRNVLDHLPEEHQSTFGTKLNNAYAMFKYDEAKRALDKIHHELMHLNPSAARSLEEGMAETLTMHQLGIPVKLRKTLSSTNVIESAFSVVETVCRNVKRWRGGDHVERWVGSGLLVAESKFRRVKGYQEIPQLMDAMVTLVSKKGVAKRAGAA